MKEMMNRVKLFVLAVSVFVIFPILVHAQSTSTILGVVKDASGGVVAGATITVTNVDTAQTRSAVSGEDGAYRVPALSAGHYSVKVEKDGFKTSTQTALTLDVAQELVVSVGLQVGSSAQEVVVTGEAPLVDTSTSTLGGLVDEQKVAELPLNGRNYIDLTLMQAGVTKNTNQGGLSTMTGTTFSSNGAPIDSNTFLLDNTSIVNPTGWGPTSLAGTTLGLDGIKEYKVITSAFSAEYGMTMGSQFVMVSKGGTNQFHGDVFEYLRNSAMDARNFFDTGYLVNNRRLPLFQRNNFGGAFGGPIKKDKTFFFAVYEGVKQNQGITILDSVPPNGCHYVAGTTTPLSAGATLTNAQCGLIPPAAGTVKLNAITAPLLALYPQASFAGNSNNYTFPGTTNARTDYGQIRVDHNFSSADSLFGRYTTNVSNVEGPISSPIAFAGTAFPNTRTFSASKDQFVTLSENHIISATLLNTARISFSRTGFNSNPERAIDIPNLPILAPGENQFGSLAISGLTGPNVAAPQYVTRYLTNTYTASDDIYYTRDKHGLKFGFLGNRFDRSEDSPSGFTGSVTYGSYADFLSAIPSKYSYTDVTISNTNRDFIYYTLGFYAQDDWRLTSRFTINMGLRYEFATTPRELSGREYALHNPQADATPIQGPIWRDRSFLNFSPRVGFAWDIFGNGKTSLRGGGGIYYDIANWTNLFVQNAFGTPPLISTTQVNNAVARSAICFPLYLQCNGNPLPASNVAHAIQGMVDYNSYQPHVLQLNLSLERQLPKNTVLTLAYAHTRGAHLFTAVEDNTVTPTYVSSAGVEYWSNNLVACENVVPSCRVNPNYTNDQFTTTVADSWYNALQTTVTKRLSSGLQFQASYTWSHSSDDTEGTLSASECNGPGMDESSDPTHLRGDIGPSCFDVRHNLRFNMLYHFPTMKSNGMLAKLANGWWMGNIVSVQGGYPFTPIVSINRSNSGVIENVLSERVNIGTATVAPGAIGPDGNANLTTSTFIPFDPSTVITGKPTQWFNPLMFTVAPMVPCPNIPTQTCGTLGTAQRGMLRGPGLGTWDFSIVKDTALRFLGESGNAEFRAEFFNILNRANFGAPSGTAFSGTTGTVVPGSTTAPNVGAYSESPLASAGLISSTVTTSRQIQLALKISF